MQQAEPLLVAFVSDLFFSTRIENAAHIAGFRMHLLERADALPGAPSPAAASGEALSGSSASLLDWLSKLQPALLIFDIDSSTLPWALWIAALKSASATRRLPLLCYGSPVDIERSARARDVGADAVVGKGRFTQALPQLIQKHARCPAAAPAPAPQRPQPAVRAYLHRGMRVTAVPAIGVRARTS